MLDGVVIVLQRGERFLVGKRAPHKPAGGYWTQVSGKVEPGESEQETVHREALEELGCRVVAREKLQQRLSHNRKYRLHYWRAEILEGLDPVFDEDIELFGRLLEAKQ